VRALASSGDTASRSESGTFPFCPNSFIPQIPCPSRVTTVWQSRRPRLAAPALATISSASLAAAQSASENLIVPT
jgi:hypothetical protein